MFFSICSSRIMRLNWGKLWQAVSRNKPEESWVFLEQNNQFFMIMNNA